MSELLHITMTPAAAEQAKSAASRGRSALEARAERHGPPTNYADGEAAEWLAWLRGRIELAEREGAK